MGQGSKGVLLDQSSPIVWLCVGIILNIRKSLRWGTANAMKLSTWNYVSMLLAILVYHIPQVFFLFTMLHIAVLNEELGTYVRFLANINFCTFKLILN